MRRLIEDIAAVVGAYVAVQLVRRLLLEREVRVGMRDLEHL